MILIEVELAVRSDELERFVEVHIVLLDVDYTARDIRAVVGNSLHIGDEIAPNKACLDSAVSDAESLDMAGSEKLLHLIDDLLERLD